MIVWKCEVKIGRETRELTVKAWTLAGVRVKLRSRGFVLVKARPSLRETISQRTVRVPLADLAQVLENLSTFYASALPARLIARLLPTPFKGRARKFAERLAAALRENPNLPAAFETAGAPEYLVETMKAVVRAGDAATSLKIVADVHKKLAQSESLMKKALFYPRLLMVILIWLVYTSLIFAIPKLGELIMGLTDSGTSMKIPVVTKMLIDAGKTVSANKLFYFFVFLGITIAAVRLITGERVFALLSKTGIARGALKDLEKVKFYSFLAMFLNTGLVLNKSLAYAASTITQKKFRQALERLKQLVDTGLTLSVAMEKVGYFDEEEIGFISTGENTGNIGEFAQKYSDICAKRFEMKMEGIINILPVLSLILVAAFVLFMAMAMLAPIYDAAMNAAM